MLRHKSINKICLAAVSLTIAAAILFTTAACLGWVEADNSMGYENRLFDTSRVHTIDIVMDDWEGFIQTATQEEYSPCTIVIDGEKYANIGIRAKGNTSLSQVAMHGNDRYSFKLEFDQYNSNTGYYGLDKFSLNNIYADNTYMKDYLSYRMMDYVGAAAPLCSYAYITVNGEDWGLYLAVEGIEESFLQRNYGKDYGRLYKPDSMNMGGGRGNGAGFNMDDFMNENESDGSRATPDMGKAAEDFDLSSMETNGFRGMPSPENMPDGFDPSAMFGGRGGGGFGGGFGGGGSSDVRLQYIDDDPESYTNIFDNAKTDATDADKTRLIASLKQLGQGEDIADVVDVDAVIRYFVAHTFLCNSDSYTGTMVHNYYLYEEDGVLAMLPWDYNLAFGGMGMGRSGSSGGATSEVNSPIDTPVSGGDMASRPMISWIFSNEEYTALYHKYYKEFIESYFDSGYFAQTLDATISMISPYVQKDPTAFCTYDEYLSGALALREFCFLRAESISGQLDGTIPSTQEGQTLDSTALIDASHINLSDMGTMGGGGGGFGRSDMGNMPDMSKMPDMTAIPNMGGASSASDGQTSGGGMPDIGDMPDISNISDMNQMPDMAAMPDTGETSSASDGQASGAIRGREGFSKSAMPEGAGFSSMPGGASQSSDVALTAEQWILLGGCILLLTIGLLVAKRYRSV